MLLTMMMMVMTYDDDVVMMKMTMMMMMLMMMLIDLLKTSRIRMRSWKLSRARREPLWGLNSFIAGADHLTCLKHNLFSGLRLRSWVLLRLQGPKPQGPKEPKISCK